MAGFILPTETDPRKIAQALHEALKGKLLCFGTFTLTPSTGSTTVLHPNCSPGAAVLPKAATAHAAAEEGNGTMWIPSATILQGSFVVQHANNAQADRTFNYIIIGGD